MMSALVIAFALSLAPAAPPANTGCQKACVKVTQKTARHWPGKRRKADDRRKAYEDMRKSVHASCMQDCSARGRAFVRCVRRAKDIQQISRCYQLPSRVK